MCMWCKLAERRIEAIVLGSWADCLNGESQMTSAFACVSVCMLQHARILQSQPIMRDNWISTETRQLQRANKHSLVGQNRNQSQKLVVPAAKKWKISLPR
jgi:hypothetical protein